MESRLSVVIPFYNRASFVRRAVQCVLSQDIAYQIIAVDDGSTDGSAETLDGLEVEIIRGKRNRGPAHARNIGFSQVRGDLVYFFDSDDELYPGALAQLVALLEERRDWNAVGARIGCVIDREGRTVDTEGCRRYCNSERPRLLTYDYFLNGPGISGGLTQFVFRKKLLDALVPIDESLRCAEDRELLMRTLKISDIPLYDISLIKRRVHGANLAVHLDENNSIALKPLAIASNFLVDLALKSAQV